MTILNNIKGTLMKIKGAINSSFVSDIKQLVKPRLISPVPSNQLINQPSKISQVANIAQKYVAPTLGKLAVRSYQTTPSTIIGTALGQALRDIITQRTKPTFISPVPQNNIPINYQPQGIPIRSTLPQPVSTSIPTTGNPYTEMIKKTWPGVEPQKVSNVVSGESSFRPNIAHINLGEKSFTKPIKNREEWVALRRQYPSIDAGLMQINTSPAMTDYLISKGLTYYDLIEKPELNLQIAYDLYSGKIPRTAPGWGNWYAARNLGYK